MNEIAALISTVGFPIVACLGIGYLYYITTTEMSDMIRDMMLAIQRNTDVITRLCDKLDMEEAEKEVDNKNG